MASKGLSPPGVPGRTTPAHHMSTRASSKADTQQTPPLSQPAKIGQKSTSRKAAKAHLASEGCLSDETSSAHSALTHSLILIIKKYTRSSPPGLINTLEAFGLLLQELKETSPLTPPAVEIITSKLGEIITNSVQKGISKLSVTLKSSLAEQHKLQDSAAALDAAASTLNKVVSDMNISITAANTATSQISETATTYKEALISTNTCLHQAPPCMASAAPSPTDQDLNLHIGLDRKARQILLDSATGEELCFNIHKIREKAEAVLADISPPPPEGTKVQEVLKLKNGSIIIQFTTKEAADWIRKPENEANFTKDLTQTCVSETEYTH
ncbi:hypothetical protein EDB84DRAFT_1566080 [Lactarius hengduanensis]|nr:hypothetical protein EDB84DRAFT_1566080 [Lactarius hengduanensis]